VNVRNQVLASAAAIGAMLAIAAWAYARVPAEMVVRWDWRGRPWMTLDRGLALLVVPLIALIVTAIFTFAPSLMPAKSRLDRSSSAWTAFWIGTLVFLLFVQATLVAANLGVLSDVPRFLSLGGAVLVFVTGNWLGKVRYNYLVGVRTPWTLADERVWDKTHRFTGRLMVLGALVLAAVALAMPVFPLSALVLYAAMILAVAGPYAAGLVYSALITRPPLQKGD
jgi:uncharacterized membrane protein